MEEKIFEVRIVKTAHIPNREARSEVKKKVASDPEIRKSYKGFAKVTYVTSSPHRIHGVEPIKGTIIDYFESVSGSDFSIF